MKTIRLTIDRGLLERLDSDADVARDGRSAVIARAISEFLEPRRQRARIRESYARGYARGVTSELDGWADA
jgi:metal-responsive CopG/Arc/MetJ family transcriptional regulator